MEELKPCPFCGKKDNLRVATEKEITGDDHGLTDYFAVYCGNTCMDIGCHATGGYSNSEEGAIARWNRRDLEVSE